MAALFFVTTIICALGWLSRYISCTSLIYYMKQKGYKLPNDEEMKECALFAAKHIFR